MQLLEVFQAATVILCDRPKEGMQLGALFFFSRTQTDHAGLVELAVDLHRSSVVHTVFLNGSDGEREGRTTPGEANPGKAFYIAELTARGVPGEQILLARPTFNTFAEGMSFVELTRELDFRSAGVLSQPHQVLRAYLGIVRAMEKAGHLMRIHAFTPSHTNWSEEVCGSQGMHRMPRFGHLEQEFQRIPLYQQRGDLVSIAELLAYLKDRDAGKFD